MSIVGQALHRLSQQPGIGLKTVSPTKLQISMCSVSDLHSVLSEEEKLKKQDIPLVFTVVGDFRIWEVQEK